MLKRPITYENFNGEQVTKTYYFHISKAELIDMQLTREEATFSDYIQKIVDAANQAELVKEFKKLVLLAYGEKSADGESFVKSDELREAFQQTAAYQALYSELAMDDGAAIKFLRGVLPSEFGGEFDKAAKTIQAPPLAPPQPEG